MFIDPMAMREIFCQSRGYAACPPGTVEDVLAAAALLAVLVILYMLAAQVSQVKLRR